MRPAFIDRIPWRTLSERSLLFLLAFAILWKGGKSLETTWLLVALAWLCTYGYYAERRLGDVKRVHPLLWSSVMLFILWTAVSYLTSTTKNYGLDEVLRDGSLGLLFLWTIRKVPSAKFQVPEQMAPWQRGASGSINLVLGTWYLELQILRTIVWATLFACIVGVAVYMLQPVNRFVGTFFDYRFHTDYWPNAWAQFLLLAWPILLLWLSRMNVYSFVRLFVFGFVFSTLLLSYSRGALIAFAGQIVLFAVLLWRERGGGLPWKQIAMRVSATALIAVGFFVLINGLRGRIYEVQSVREKATFTADEGGSSVSERGAFWEQASRLSFQRPLFGWGPYSFRFVQPKLQGAVLATSDHPHNVFLKLAAERGWPAALLFALILGTVFVSSLLRFFASSSPSSNEQTNKRTNGVHFSIAIAIAGVLSHNMIDYNLQFVGIALPFWLMLGVLAAEIPSGEGRILSNKFVRIVEVAIATALVVVAISEGRYLLLSSLGRRAEARGDAPAALSWYQLSRNERFSRDMHLSRAKILYGGKSYAEARNAIDEYLSQNREDARARKILGDIALAEGKADEAARHYGEAYAMNRWNDLGITRGLLDALVASDRRADAAERRAELDDLLARFEEAIRRNAHFVALSPNVEEFIAITRILGGLFPEDAPRYDVMAARVDHAATLERGKIAARPPGYLW